MRSFKIVIIMALLGGLALGWIGHQEHRELQRQNAGLREKLAEMDRLRAENDVLGKISFDPAQLEQLRSERNELMRLRSEVGELRRTAGVSEAELQKRLETTLAHAKSDQQAGDLIQARYDSKQQSKEIRGELGAFHSWFRLAARFNDGQLPDSIAQLRSILAGVPEGDRYRRVVEHILSSTNELSEWSQTFEFVPRAQPLTGADKPALFLRERKPRSAPDGGWLRAYTFVDGKPVEALSPDGNFEVWERQQARPGHRRDVKSP